eukprot:4601314-Prymnesium_polylepis.2
MPLSQRRHLLWSALVVARLSAVAAGPVQSVVGGSIGKNWTSLLVEKFDTRTVQDLSELTQDDLARIGLTTERRQRFSDAVQEHLRALHQGKTGPRAARERAVRQIVQQSAASGVPPPLEQILVASGTTFWAPRFDGLGVRCGRARVRLSDAREPARRDAVRAWASGSVDWSRVRVSRAL